MCMHSASFLTLSFEEAVQTPLEAAASTVRIAHIVTDRYLHVQSLMTSERLGTHVVGR